MNKAFFSLNKHIVGKNKNTVTYVRPDGRQVTMLEWAAFKNKAQNYTCFQEVDDRVRYVEASRAQVIDLVAVKGYATGYLLKDDSLPKKRTVAANTAAAGMMMLDFDNTWSMQEAMQHPWWKKAWFAYTTPSFGKLQEELTNDSKLLLPAHQVEAIQAGVGKPKRNFRLVFRFEQLLPVEDIKLVGSGFMSIFNMADISCTDAARIIFGCVNAVVEMPEVEYRLTAQDVAELKLLGEKWLQNEKGKTVTFQARDAKLADGEVNHTITLADGAQWTVQELIESMPVGWKEACFSPFRTELHPSAFVRILDSGDLFAYDSGSATKYIWKAKKQEQLQLKKKEVVVEEEQALPNEVTVPEQRQFQQLTGAAERRRAIGDYVKWFLKNKFKHGIVRTPEGYGKSTAIVDALIRAKKKVIFCCGSNAQAREKTESFKLYGAKRAKSFAAVFEESLGFAPIFIERGGAWDLPELDVTATIELMCENLGCTADDAKTAIDEMKDDAASSRELNSAVIVTTFDMGNVIYVTNNCTTGYVFVVDDPSMSNLFIQDWQYDDNNMPFINEQRDASEVMFGREDPFQDKIIWTTTEKLVMEAVKKLHQDNLLLNVDESLDNDNDILLIPTMLTRKALKPILPGMHKCIMEDCHLDNVHFMSDGVGADINLVSSKGRNDLTGDAVIVASFPHPIEVLNTLALIDEGDQWEVRRQMVIDKLNQALGRGQGYRQSNSRALVLCDPQLEILIKNRCRYRVCTIDGMKRRGKLKGVPVEWAPHIPNWWSGYLAYLQTWHEYVKIIGSRVINVINLYSCEIHPRDMKQIEDKLEKPVKSTHYMWKQVMEIIESDTGRRNFSETIAVLSQKINENHAKHTSISRASAGGKGKKKYVSPHGQTKMYVPGSEPEGWSVYVAPTRKQLHKKQNQVGGK